jgi:hypothetical protein
MRAVSRSGYPPTLSRPPAAAPGALAGVLLTAGALGLLAVWRMLGGHQPAPIVR